MRLGGREGPVGRNVGRNESPQVGETRVLELAGVPEATLVEVLVLAAKADRRDYVEQVLDEVKRRASRGPARVGQQQSSGTSKVG